MSRSTELEALLRHHVSSDALEAQHRDRMLNLLAGTVDPFSRSSFRPGHFTASAFVISPDGRSLLLIHHKKLGRWLQPGGHVESDDDDVIAAARRELREEVGLAQLELEHAGVFDLDVHPIPPLGSEPPHEHFDVRMLFRAQTASVEAGSEVRAARFFPLAEIANVESDESVMRAVRKLYVRADSRS